MFDAKMLYFLFMTDKTPNYMFIIIQKNNKIKVNQLLNSIHVLFTTKIYAAIKYLAFSFEQAFLYIFKFRIY